MGSHRQREFLTKRGELARYGGASVAVASGIVSFVSFLMFMVEKKPATNMTPEPVNKQSTYESQYASNRHDDLLYAACGSIAMATSIGVSLSARRIENRYIVATALRDLDNQIILLTQGQIPDPPEGTPNN